jgi:hypothetical protein
MSAADTLIMAHWKRRRPREAQADEAGVSEKGVDRPDSLRRQLARHEEEITFLRAQLAEAVTGWREAQQQLLVLEAECRDPEQA